MHVVVSQGQFAKRAGVSAMAVSKAVASGRLKRDPAGGVDISHPLSVEYLKRPGRQREVQKLSAKTKQKVKASQPSPSSVTQIKAETVNIGAPAESDGGEYQDLGLQKRVEELRKIRIQNAILRGQYVQREIVRRWTMAFFSVIVSVFRNLAERIMPELVASIRSCPDDSEAISAGTKILNDEVFRGLKNIRTTASDFHSEIPDPADNGEPEDGGDVATG